MVAVFTVLFNKFGMPHFFEGVFGGEARVGGFHGAEFINLEFAIELGEAVFGVDGGVFEVGEFKNEPDEGHGDKSYDE